MFFEKNFLCFASEPTVLSIGWYIVLFRFMLVVTTPKKKTKLKI